MDVSPIIIETLGQTLVGAAFLAMLAYTFVQRKDLMKAFKQLADLAKEQADRQERLANQYAESIKANTEVTVALHEYLKGLNGSGGSS